MSFAFSAASVNSTNNNNNNLLNRKKIHNRTQRLSHYPSNPDKLNKIVSNIHERFIDDDYELNSIDQHINKSPMQLEELNNNDMFNFPPNPISVGVLNTENSNEMHEAMSNNNTKSESDIKYNPNIKSYDDDAYDLQKIKNTHMSEQQVKRYYQKLTSNYGKPNPTPVPEYYTPTKIENMSNLATLEDPIMNKLNHIINLLEESQDEKSGNVQEEMILYSFLGVFVIFIVDGILRIKKYTR